MTQIIDTCGMASVSDFVHYVTAATYESQLTALAEACADIKGSQLARVRLPEAWQTASQTMVARAPRCQGAGPAHAANDLDDPLPTQTQGLCEKAWQDRYNPRATVHLHPSDPLAGRLYREMRRQSAPVKPATKIRARIHAA